MKTYRMVVTVLLAVFSLMALVAQPALADRKSDLQEKFKSRYKSLAALKSAGKIGETFDGKVEAVSGGLDKNQEKLVDDENADRNELYELIAKEQNTTAQLVAERNGARNFEKAGKGEYLKDKDGSWKKKGG